MCTLPLCELLEGALGVPLVLAVPWHEEQQQIDLVQATFVELALLLGTDG